VATQTSPRDWWDEPDGVLATALDVLADQADRIDRANPRAMPARKMKGD
jgi:hypothetical protein